jgi:hypothetical protein
MPLLHRSKVFSCQTELLEYEIWPEVFFLLISYFQFCKEVWVFSLLLFRGIWLRESLPSYYIFLCIYSFMRIEFERLSLLFILLVFLFFILVYLLVGFLLPGSLGLYLEDFLLTSRKSLEPCFGFLNHEYGNFSQFFSWEQNVHRTKRELGELGIVIWLEKVGHLLHSKNLLLQGFAPKIQSDCVSNQLWCATLK